MAIATASVTGELVTVELGRLIAERRYNFRQGGVNLERVETYYRRLCNGENPPPIEVDKRTNTIIDGMHRYQVWKMRAEETLGRSGKDWRTFKVDVLMTDCAPDRDERRYEWLVETVKRNREHGEPPKREDVLRLLKQIIRDYRDRKEEARRMALEMNETNDSFEAHWRKIHGRPETKPITFAEGRPAQPPARMPEAARQPAPAEIVRQSPLPASAPPEAPKVEDKPKETPPVQQAPKTPPQQPPKETPVAAAVQLPTQPAPRQTPPPPKNRYPFMVSYADQLRKWIEGATEFTPEQIKALNLLRAAMDAGVPVWR